MYNDLVVDNIEDILRNKSKIAQDNLKSLLQLFNNLYRCGKKTITDAQFDELMLEYKNKFGDLELIKDEIVLDSSKIEHITPMKSMNNITINNLEKFLERLKVQEYSVVIQPKIDGVSCALHYNKDGQFIYAVTRGDGLIGEDISSTVRMLNSVPSTLTLDYDRSEIRGELYMDKTIFEEHWLPLGYKNARNIVAGCLRKKSPIQEDLKGIRFIAYDMISYSANMGKIKQNETSNTLEWLTYVSLENEELLHNEIWKISYSKDGTVLKIAPTFTANSHDYTVNHIVNVCEELLKNGHSNLPYQTDGIVIKYVDTQVRENMGSSSQSVNWAIAIKPDTKKVEAIASNVVWQKNKGQDYTPVLQVKPVEVGGVIVSACSLFNLANFEKQNLGPNDKIMIARMGEVVPNLVEVTERSIESRFTHPTHCYECGAELIKDSVRLFCENLNCGIKKKILHWCKTRKIRDWGDTLTTKLSITKISDLYDLSVSDLMLLDRVGEKLAKKLYKAMQQDILNNDMTLFITALSIPGVGRTKAEKIVSVMKEKLKTDGYNPDIDYNTYCRDYIKNAKNWESYHSPTQEAWKFVVANLDELDELCDIIHLKMF